MVNTRRQAPIPAPFSDDRLVMRQTYNLMYGAGIKPVAMA